MRLGPGPSCALLVLAAVGLTWLPARHARPSEAARRAATSARIGLVFDVGGRGDKSFNDAADAGLARAERELGVSASFLEPVGTEDREAAMRLFAAQGLDLVIAVGFIFSSDVDCGGGRVPGRPFRLHRLLATG